MLLRFPSFCRFALLGAALAGCPALAQLAANSPFQPQGAAAAAGPAATGSLEFRGFMDSPNGERLFRINDTARKTGAFVKLGERHEELGVSLKQYDAGNNSIIVEHDGRSVTLQRRESKIVSAGPAAQLMPAPPQPNVAPAVTQSVVVNPTTADEQRRLEAVAAEVARRRALREQAGQQLNQGSAPVQMGFPQPAPAPVQFQPQSAPGGAINVPGSPQNGPRRPLQTNGRPAR